MLAGDEDADRDFATSAGAKVEVKQIVHNIRITKCNVELNWTEIALKLNFKLN